MYYMNIAMFLFFAFFFFSLFFCYALAEGHRCPYQSTTPLSLDPAHVQEEGITDRSPAHGAEARSRSQVQDPNLTCMHAERAVESRSRVDGPLLASSGSFLLSFCACCPTLYTSYVLRLRIKLIFGLGL